ncbi:MAG: sigma-70 family RNA polymerase sigma factor [Myxococcota bacterium]
MGDARDPKDPPGPSGPATESALVARLREGDAAAFEELVRAQGPRMLSVAQRYLQNEDDARECVQEAFLAAHRSIGRFEGRALLGTWLHRIVVNAALMRLRSRRAKPEELLEDWLPRYDRYGFREGPVHTNDLTPEELYRRADTAKHVREAIERLPESHRTVLFLRDIDGFSTEETAELLGTSRGSIKMRLHRARSALRTLLAPLFAEDAD